MSQFTEDLGKVWEDIKNLFNTTVVDVNAEFVNLVGEDQAKTFVAAVEDILKTSVGKIVVDIVGTVTADELANNSAARAAVIEKIIADLKGQGLSASTQIIDLLINLAIWIVKSKAQ